MSTKWYQKLKMILLLVLGRWKKYFKPHHRYGIEILFLVFYYLRYRYYNNILLLYLFMGLMIKLCKLSNFRAPFY